MSAAADTAVAGAVRTRFESGRSTRVWELVFKGCLASSIVACLIVLLTLLIQVFSEGLGSLSLSFLTDTPSRIDPASSGIGPALAGTLWLMAVCTAFIIPVGVATAVYLEEYANRERWFNRFIEV